MEIHRLRIHPLRPPALRHLFGSAHTAPGTARIILQYDTQKDPAAERLPRRRSPPGYVGRSRASARDPAARRVARLAGAQPRRRLRARGRRQPRPALLALRLFRRLEARARDAREPRRHSALTFFGTMPNETLADARASRRLAALRMDCARARPPVAPRR